jgi:hypothetical protein
VGVHVKILLENFLSEQLEPVKLNKLYNNLSPYERAQFLTKILQYIVPRQKADEINFNNLTPDQARQIILALMDEQMDE